MPTAWSSSSSLTSERIPPPRQQHQSKSKGKGKAATPEPQKSKAARELEARLDGARASKVNVKDPKGGCFCQARKHALSTYVPMCRQCGLILCKLNPPHHACPHCAGPLLNGLERAELVVRLDTELAAQLAQEEAERQRVIDEARAAEGAFPMLPGSQPKPAGTAPPTTRMVLSLNSEKKTTTVSSYSTPTMVSRPGSRMEDRDAEERVPGPPKDVNYVMEPVDPERPWRNVRAGDVRYVPPPGAAHTKGKQGRGEQTTTSR